MRKSKQNKGFTLLEILLVIAAIGILAAIVLVAINPNRQLAQARNLVRQADINTIQKALEQYLIENGSYPNSVSTTPGYICNTGKEQTGGSTNCSGRVDLRELVPTYIAGIPKDPQVTGTNTGYNIVINPNNNKVGVAAELAESKLISINPYVINNGLVLHLDAGNPSSYPGTGTTWFDLSGNGNNGTLVNGVGYNSANGGSLVFDKVNDHISVTPINRLNTTTLDIWFNTSSISTNTTVRQYLYTQQRNPPTLASFTYQERQGIHIAGNAFHFQYLNTDNTDITLQSISTISANTWYNFVVTLDGTTPKMYLNGVELIATILSGKTNTTSKSITVNQAFVGRRGDANGEDLFGGNIASVKDYNRALTPEEVQQNFNATRGRFGI
jgi:prepilin-type N-terminal cleavage/methylation domain-containing protein